MNNTKKLDYCPEWFDLEDYKGLSKIDRLKWKWLVDMKSFFFDVLNNEDLQALAFNKEEQSLRLEIAVFSTKSVIHREIHLEPEPIKNVRELKEEIKAFYGNDEEGNRYMEDLQDIQYQINTDYSDEVIIAAIKEELVKIRSRQRNNSGKRYSDSYIQNLVNDNVIPYIDLMLWQKITKNYLTDTQIANLILPNEYNIDRVNKVRKTVKVKADELLSTRGRKFI